MLKYHFHSNNRKEFEKWRAIRASVGGVLAWVTCRPWHDARAIAHPRTVTRANQEKGGLGGR